MQQPFLSGLFRARSRSSGRSRSQNFGEVDLTPSVVDRLVAIAKPNRARGSTVRKIAALALAVLGIVLLFRGDPDTDTVRIVTAARDVIPGQLVTADDLGISEFPADHLPDGTLTEVGDVVGSTVAGPVRRGEIVTDVRVLGSRLARESTGTDDARIVPVRLADAAVSDIVRSGDIVDVLTVGPDTPNEQTNDNNPTILASDAVVVLVTAAESARNQREQVIMLALPTAAATRVAAASLVNAITVTFK